MQEIYLKIGEVAEILGIEPYTLRYLENTLKLRIKRDERGERIYAESDLDTLRLILQLKNEKGLNTTAIKMALENLQESDANNSSTAPQVYTHYDLLEIVNVTKSIMQQNDEILAQNKKMQERLQAMEESQIRQERTQNEKMEALLNLLRDDGEEKKPGWLSKLIRK